MKIKIGFFNETASRKLTERTSYAADRIEHETKPGKYPVYLTIESGYTIPMPYWLCYGIGSEIVEELYYSGFGGVNYHCDHKTERRASEYYVQTYAYLLPEMVEKGLIELLPGMEWALNRLEHGKTWKELALIAS